MASALIASRDLELRAARWRKFQVVFTLTCIAIALDLSTTYLGFQREGARFEQNGIALFLIQRIGWVGITAILLVACTACFKSFKTVYWKLSLRWSLWLNVLLIAACAFRWLVVVTDTLWLMR